jgi:hypothetical protein
MILTKAIEFNNSNVILNVHNIQNINISEDGDARFFVMGYVDETSFNNKKDAFFEDVLSCKINIENPIMQQLYDFLQTNDKYKLVIETPEVPVDVITPTDPPVNN